MSNGKPKILIVEDMQGWNDIFTRDLSDCAELVFARTPDEAKDLIQSTANIDIIAVDGSLLVLNDGPEVVRYARKYGFTGTIIATSSVRASDALLLEAGANEAMDKVFLVKNLRKMAAALG